MKSLCVTVLSMVLTGSVIGNAYYQKQQFYPSVVYITKSNPSMAVMYLQAFVLVLLVGKLMKKVFFGQLRAAEFEHLIERSWYAITETCLAFTVFRDDFTPKFIALFTVLLFLKAFHWLAEDRVDYMERSPVIGWVFHTRMVALLLLLAELDLFFILHAYSSTITKGASVQLVFGFEYAILIIMVFNIAVKYLLHVVDSHWEAPWESKAAVLLYTELVIGLVKVLLYTGFVAVMARIYTLPLFAFRPMYYTLRNFKKAFSDVVLSRRAIRNMNTLYPNATPEELAAVDNVCIICREEMQSGAKKLPCNHIFHAACLRSWFQRQQTCPTCRLNVLRVPTPTTNVPQAAPGGPQQPNANFPQPNVIFGQPNANFLQPNGNFPQPNVNFPQPNVNFPQPNANFPQPNVNFPQPNVNFPQPNVNFPQPNANGIPAPTMGVPPAGAPLNMPFLPHMPPFMGGFMFPPPPPPPPPASLVGLTDEELARLEGTERANTEARIQLLRDIQLMLDSAVMMMQQYCAAVARMPVPVVTPSVATVVPTPTTNMPSVATATRTATSASPTVATATAAAAATPSTTYIPDAAGKIPTKETSNVVPDSSEVPSTSGFSRADDKSTLTLNSADPNPTPGSTSRESSTEEDSMAAELRRRRLQKFSQEN